eukprot:TRINITY_DN2317_c2_g1_i2.p1 TRINITY_DN2317_c2_g1~~TRINITY_DN2317_c2_g1_i2.p1  ORF type:complete len:849 (+),score=286.91 TRINITY_DN2317_c2_g1_i2:371-2917(+)
MKHSVGYRGKEYRASNRRHRPTESSRQEEMSMDTRRTQSNNSSEYFAFRQRRGHFDWRVLAQVDVDRVIRETDLNALQKVIDNITFADVDLEMHHNGRVIDGEFAKVIRLCQLTIEYLLYVQRVLDAENHDLKNAHSNNNEHLELYKEQAYKLGEELKAAKRDRKELRKTLNVYELLMRVPKAVPHSTSDGHRCQTCNKTFESSQFLGNHMERRHGIKFEPGMVSNDAQPPIPQTPQDYVSNEMREILALQDKLKIDAERTRLQQSEMRNEYEASIQRERHAARQREEALERAQHEINLKHEEEMRQLVSTIRREMNNQRSQEMVNLNKDLIDRMQQSGLSGELEDVNPQGTKNTREKIEKRMNEEDQQKILENMLKKETERIQRNFEKQLAEERQKQEARYREETRKRELEMRRQVEQFSQVEVKLKQSQVDLQLEKRERHREREEQKQNQREMREQLKRENHKPRPPPPRNFQVEKNFQDEEEVEIQEMEVEESDVEEEEPLDLPVAGKYVVIKERPYLTAMYTHDVKQIKDYRMLVAKELNKELDMRNIPAGTLALTNQDFKFHMKQLSMIRSERDTQDIQDTRDMLVSQIESIVSKYYRPAVRPANRPSTSQPARSTTAQPVLRSTASQPNLIKKGTSNPIRPTSSAPQLEKFQLEKKQREPSKLSRQDSLVSDPGFSDEEEEEEGEPMTPIPKRKGSAAELSPRGEIKKMQVLAKEAQELKRDSLDSRSSMRDPNRDAVREALTSSGASLSKSVTWGENQQHKLKKIESTDSIPEISEITDVIEEDFDDDVKDVKSTKDVKREEPVSTKKPTNDWDDGMDSDELDAVMKEIGDGEDSLEIEEM